MAAQSKEEGGGSKSIQSQISSLAFGGGSKKNGPFSGVRKLFRGAFVRSMYSLVQTLGALFDVNNLPKVLGAQLALLVAFTGPKHAASTLALALAATSGTKFVSTFVSTDAAPEEQDLMSFEPPDSLSGGSGGWGMLTELASAYQQVFEAFPELQLTKLTAMRDEAFPELALRMMTIVSDHTAGRVCPLRIGCTDTAPHKADDSVTPADEEDVEKLRQWLPYAEAPYYESATETMLSDWLADRNYTMVMARMTSEQNTPMFAVATHNDKKQLLILVRGTMSFPDAVTDMVVTPISWDDGKHQVHKGIGSCATNLHRRLRRVARVFSDSGHDIVVVGHSLGAGAAALLAWRLKSDGCASVRAFAFACPPCASLSLAQDCEDCVVSCVMRDDAIPRAVPRALVLLERTLLDLDWDHMRERSGDWGMFGKWVLENAEKGKEAARKAVEATDDSEAQETAEALLTDQGGVKDPSVTERMVPMVPGRIVYMQPAKEQQVPVPATPSAVLPDAHANDSQLRQEKRDEEAREQERRQKAEEKRQERQERQERGDLGEGSAQQEGDGDEAGERGGEGGNGVDVSEGDSPGETNRKGSGSKEDKYKDLKSAEELAEMVREAAPFYYEYIPPCHAVLATLRLSPNAINDHNLDAYRLGLGMPSKLEDHKADHLEASTS